MADWERMTLGDIPIYQAETLARLPGIVQGFSTRQGGTSLAPYDSMNLGAHVGDDPGAVDANRRKLCAGLNCLPSQVALAEQVHGNGVALVDTGGGDAALGVDALMTQRPGLLLMLFFADCVPVYVVDPVHRAIALIHAGWRGTATGIVPRTLRAMGEAFDSRPGDCLAAIGPCIGAESYEVGQDVVDQFRRLEPLRSVNAILPKNELADTFTLDLRRVLCSQLLGSGFRAESVSASGADTSRHCEEFFSYRRDGKATGRMAGFLALRPIRA